MVRVAIRERQQQRGIQRERQPKKAPPTIVAVCELIFIYFFNGGRRREVCWSGAVVLMAAGAAPFAQVKKKGKWRKKIEKERKEKWKE
jgi:hypothetical protein